MAFYLYIIQSQKDGSYYVGSTKDLVRRLKRHNEGRSKYTKGRRPWELVYNEEYPDRPTAMKREQEIKRRKDKLFIANLVRTSRPRDGTAASFPVLDRDPRQ